MASRVFPIVFVLILAATAAFAQNPPASPAPTAQAAQAAQTTQTTPASPGGPEGNWTIERFVFAPFPEIAEADAKTFVGKQATVGKNRIVFDGSVCKTEGFERKAIDPVKFFESYDTDPNLFDACGKQALFVRTKCEDTPFSEFVWLGGDKLVFFWEGAFFVLGKTGN